MIILASAIGIGATMAIFANTKSPINKVALSEDAGYNFTLDSSSGDTFKYHYLEKTIVKKKYNDEDIIFKYKRCRNTSSKYLTMSPGGKFYNPYIGDVDGLNGLSGMSSITVNFTTLTGKLFISYGLDEEYIQTDMELTSGSAYEFLGFKPSHFMLYTVDDVNASNDVTITSISISYHSDSYYDEKEYSFTDVYTSTATESIPSGGSKTYSLNSTDIGTNNYINIRYKSSKQLKGTLNYYDITRSRNVSETIFLEESLYPVDFNTFLDNFRKGSSGITNKRLTSLVLTNVSDSAASVNIYSVGYTDRVYSRTDVLYIYDSTIEVGVSLQFAGSVSSLKNLNRNIQEYVDTSANIKIRGSDKHSGDVNNVIRNNPNLINVYDVGRELQQSWYINVDEDQGYTRGEFGGNEVGYNPVQAGDKENNESQIIDYKVTYDSVNPAKVTSIWVKTKALDWAHNNDLSNSYMENSYVVEDGLLKVTNRFIDFSGWTNYENNAGFPSGNYNTNGNTFLSTSQAPLFAGQELPALYIAHPLQYFSTYFTDTQGSNQGKLVFDNTIGWNTGTSRIENNSSLTSNGTYEGETTYSSNSDGGAHYEFRRHTENWLGYFNEDKFGVAIYVPANNYNCDVGNDRHVFISGMLNRNHAASNSENRAYLDTNYQTQTASYSKGITIGNKTYGKVDLTKDSCFVYNTGYICTTLGFYISNYTAIEYTYLVGADYLNTLRDKFNDVQTSGSVYNDFTVFKGACI